MPAYDFQCKTCGVVFEHRLTMAEYASGARPKCPECASPKPERIFSSEINVLTSSVPTRWRQNEKPKTPHGCCGGGSCGCSSG